MTKKNLRLFDKEELTTEMEALGEKKFRTSQLFQWLWKYRTLNFSKMKNIPKPLQAKLQELYILPETAVSIFQQSQDGTIKVGFETYDKETIEGVIIPSEDRITACISSQVGCSLSCTFCATGFLPRKRNLFAFEIYDQVYLLNELALKHYEKPLTNIVYMGMGEPLLNYDEVVKSLHRLHSEDEGLGIGAKRITVSTSGIVRNIKKLADEGLKINLALSLHAATNEKRTAFLQTLRDKGVSSKIRKSRGKDIDAACGQLANKVVKLQLDV